MPPARRLPNPTPLVFASAEPEKRLSMRIGPIGLIYIVIGIIVAAVENYFDNVGSAARIGEALLAVLLWPLVLLGVDINLQ